MKLGKKISLIMIALLLIALIGGCVKYKDGKPVEETNSTPKTEQKAEQGEDKGENSASTAEEEKIDTSVFSYAEKVEVTNAIDVNQHVTVFVNMSNEVAPGLATQHVINQAYDFLQQVDIEGAKTVTISVKQGELKIAQITIDKDKFVPNDQEPMVKNVLAVSQIDFMTPEVKEFGAATNSW